MHDDDIDAQITLTNEVISEIRYETERIERYIDGKTDRLYSLLIFAGLTTFISFNFISKDFLKLYLISILPLLLVSLSITVIATKLRKSILPNGLPFGLGDKQVVLGLLEMRRELAQKALQTSRESLNKISEAYRLSLTATVLYLVSFTFNFYLSFFYRQLSVIEVIFFNILLFILGVFFYQWQKSGLQTKTLSKAINIDLEKTEPRP